MGVRKDTLQITITVDAAKARQEFNRAKNDLSGITNELKLTNVNSKRYKEILGEMAEAQQRFVDNASYNQLNNEIRKITRELKKTKEGTAEFELLEKQIIPLQNRFVELGGGLSRFNRGLGTTPTLMGKVGGAATAMGNKIKAAFAGSVVGLLVLAIGTLISKFKELGGVVNEIDKLESSVSRLTSATGAELERITSDLIATSRTFGEDTTEYLDTVNAANNEFGGGLERNLDLLQKAKQADIRGTLLDDVKEYSSQFALAESSAEQFLAIAIKAQQAGTVDNKAIDSIAEFTRSITEQTQSTRDALDDSLGKDFTNELYGRINDGSLSAIDALQEVVKEVNKQELPANELQTIYADVFKGAGEDVGKFILTLDELPTSLDEVIDSSTLANRVLVEQLTVEKELARSQSELANRFSGTGAQLSNLSTRFKNGFTKVIIAAVDAVADFSVTFRDFVAGFLLNINSLIEKFNRLPGFNIPTFNVDSINEETRRFEAELKRRRTLATAENQIEKEKTDRLQELITKRKSLSTIERKELIEALQDKERLSTREQIILNDLQKTRVKSYRRASELTKQQIQVNKELEKSIESLGKAAEKEIELAIKSDTEGGQKQLDAFFNLQEKLSDLKETVAIEINTEIEFENEDSDFDEYIDQINSELEAKLANTNKFDAKVETLVAFALETSVDTADLANAQREIYAQEFDTELQRQEALLQLETEYAERRKANALEILEAKLETMIEGEEGYSETLAAVNELRAQNNEAVAEKEVKTAEETAAKRQQIQQNIVSSLQAVTSTFSSFFEIQKQRELKAAGDNAKKREEIEREFAKKRQGIQLAEAIINTAVAVSGALQMQPFLPVGLLASIAAGAQGAAQIATIKAQQFATGGFTITDDAGRPVRSRMDFAQGGWADKPSHGIVGEAGTEWVANNKTVNDPVTGPIVKLLHKHQIGERVSVDDFPTRPNKSLIDQARQYKTLVTDMSQGLARVEREITHYVEVVKPAMVQATANGLQPRPSTKEVIVKETKILERMVVVDEITALQKERAQKAKRARIV